MTGILVILAILAFVVIAVVGIYNGLVRLRNQVKDAWAQIEVQLKRRHDLIPNLIETAKGYMKHERQTLEAVTRARASAAGAQALPDIAKAETGLSAALAKLFAVAEAYPDLKANQNFLALQEELTSTENRISFARQFYNDSVMNYNNKIQMVPSNIVAQSYNFKTEEFFELEDAAEREVPKVDFS